MLPPVSIVLFMFCRHERPSHHVHVQAAQHPQGHCEGEQRLPQPAADEARAILVSPLPTWHDNQV